MDIQKAIEIIKSLAKGLNPISGEPLPSESPYNQPDIIRAFFAVLERLPKPKRSHEEKQAQNIAKGLPRNLGLPWTEESRRLVADLFQSGTSIEDLAQSQERTRTAIVAELLRQELIKPEEGEKLLGGVIKLYGDSARH